MKERHKELYRRFSQAALPVACVAVVWLAVERAEYKERLYRETPSIPFQPFCDEGGNWGDIRPIRGVKVSDAFLKEAVTAMSSYGSIMQIAYMKRDGDRMYSNPYPVLITPTLFYNSDKMLWITREAINAVHGFPIIASEEDGAPSLKCDDIEGNLVEF